MDTDKALRVLITAFDPFGGEGVNASQRVLEALPPRLGRLELTRLLLPTAFAAAPELTIRTAEALRPAAILCLGQAAGRTAVTPERVAINLMDARIPDNAGAQPVDEPIDPEGPAAYFSTLPLRRMLAALGEAGVPAQLSNTAGTFVCNCLMYRMLRYVSLLPEQVPCGFVHVPALPEQGGAGLPLPDLVRGVEAVLGTLA